MRNWLREKANLIKVSFLGLISFALISCSVASIVDARANNSSINENTTSEVKTTDVNSYEDVPDNKFHKTSFTKSLVGISNGGLAFNIDFGQIIISPKDESKTGKNVLDLSGTTGTAMLDGFTVHDLSLALDAPIKYNGIRRDLSVALTNDNLYFRIANVQTSTDTYQFAYKATLDAYDTTYNNQTIDPITGGIYRFSYGNLDVFIHDIMETLTQNGEDIDDPVSSASSDEESSSVFNASELIASLDSLEETTLNGKPYFVMEVDSSDRVFKIGFQTDTEFNLTRLDFPAYQGSTQTSCFIKDNIEMQFRANISSTSTKPVITVENEGMYQTINDSTALFKKIARNINKKQFNVDVDLSLLHYEAAISSETDGNKPEVNETIDINGDVSINFNSGNVDDLGLHVDLTSYKNNKVYYSQFLEAFYEKDGTENANQEILLNYNNITQLKTSKTVVDALIDNFKQITNNENVINSNLSNLISISNYVFDGVDAIVNSSLLTNVKEGKYHDILDMITVLQNGTNYLKVALNLANVGLNGSAIIELNDVSDDGPLATITFTDVSMTGTTSKQKLEIDGTVILTPYSKITSSYDMSNYKEMTHLESVADQIRLLAGSGKADFTVKGYILKNKINDVGTSKFISTEPTYNNKTLQGFTFEGGFRFDLEAKKGSGNVTFTDRKEKYRNDHTLKLDLEGPEATDDDGNSTEQDNYTSSYTSGVNNMLFEYNSKNVTTSLSKKSTSGYDSGYTYNDSDGKTRTEPHNGAMKGRFSLHSLNGILDVVRNFQDQDDGRLSRLFSALSTSNTLIDEITNRQYSTLLTRPMITSLTIGSNNTCTIKIAEWVMGTDGDITIEIGFSSSYSPDLPDSELATKAGIKSLKVSLKTFGDEDDDEDFGKSIYIEIGVSKIIDENTEITMNWPNQTSSTKSSNFTDYSSIKKLAEYALNTFYLNCPGITTYHISGNAHLSLIDDDVPFNFYLRLEGKDIKMYGEIKIPVKIIVVRINADPNCKLIGGDSERYVHMYGHFTPNKDNNRILIERVDAFKVSSGFLGLGSKKTSKLYNELMTPQHFTKNLLGWLLKYILGLNDLTNSLIEDIETGTNSIHGEDMISGFSYNSSSDSWNLTLGVDALAHSNALSSVGLKINTTTLGGKKYLYGLETTSNLSLASIINVSLNLSIANISSGSYKNCWNNSSYKATHHKRTSDWYSNESNTPNYFYNTYFANASISNFNRTPYNY